MAAREDLQVVEIKRESHSAKESGKRPEFTKLLEEIRGLVHCKDCGAQMTRERAKKQRTEQEVSMSTSPIYCALAIIARSKLFGGL